MAVKFRQRRTAEPIAVQLGVQSWWDGFQPAPEPAPQQPPPQAQEPISAAIRRVEPPPARKRVEAPARSNPAPFHGMGWLYALIAAGSMAWAFWSAHAAGHWDYKAVLFLIASGVVGGPVASEYVPRLFSTFRRGNTPGIDRPWA